MLYNTLISEMTQSFHTFPFFPSAQKLQKNKKKQKTVFFPTKWKEIRLGFFIRPQVVFLPKKATKTRSSSPSNSSKSFGSTSSALPTCRKMNGNRQMVGLLRRKNSFKLKNCDEMVLKIVTTTEIFGVQNGFRKKTAFKI